MAQHTFPPLPLDDIVACLNELNAPISIDILRNPQPKEVRLLYERLVISCLGVSNEVFQMPFQLIEELDNPSAHEKSYAIKILFGYMKKIARSACIRDFCLTDMFAPEGKRLCFILSGIINYEKYRADKVSLFDRSQDHIVIFFIVILFIFRTIWSQKGSMLIVVLKTQI